MYKRSRRVNIIRADATCQLISGCAPFQGAASIRLHFNFACCALLPA
jgi:hypothetical protein